jgi:hypothetical protein
LAEKNFQNIKNPKEIRKNPKIFNNYSKKIKYIVKYIPDYYKIFRFQVLDLFDGD